MATSCLLHLLPRVIEGEDETFSSRRTQHTLPKGLEAGSFEQQRAIAVAVRLAQLTPPLLDYLWIGVVECTDVKMIVSGDVRPTL